MAYPGYGAFQIGSSPFPLPASTSNSLLQDADTPLYWLLDFFASELQTYAGARWANEVARAGLSTELPSIVGMKFPNNPIPYLQDTGATFPILALYRVDGTYKERSASYVDIRSNIELMWVLPPLTMGQVEILGPFFNAVADILQDRAEYGFDPNYLDGYNYGQAAGYDWITMSEYHRMLIDSKSKTTLPMETLVMQLQMSERNMPVPNAFPTVTEVATEIDLLPASNDIPDTTLPNFVDLNSNYDPTNFNG